MKKDIFVKKWNELTKGVEAGDYSFIAVETSTPETSEGGAVEIIVNSVDSLDRKFERYMSSYNDDMQFTNFPELHVVDVYGCNIDVVETVEV